MKIMVFLLLKCMQCICLSMTLMNKGIITKPFVTGKCCKTVLIWKQQKKQCCTCVVLHCLVFFLLPFGVKINYFRDGKILKNGMKKSSPCLYLKGTRDVHWVDLW